jgi:hypothetical protein
VFFLTDNTFPDRVAVLSCSRASRTKSYDSFTRLVYGEYSEGLQNQRLLLVALVQTRGARLTRANVLTASSECSARPS